MARAQRPEQRGGGAEGDGNPQNTNAQGIRAPIDLLLRFAELHLPAERRILGTDAHGSAGDQRRLTIRQPLESRSARLEVGECRRGRRRRPHGFDRRRFLEHDSAPSPAEQRVRSHQHRGGAVQHQRLRGAARARGIAQMPNIAQRPAPIQMRRNHPDDASGRVFHGRGQIPEQGGAAGTPALLDYADPWPLKSPGKPWLPARAAADDDVFARGQHP